MEADLFAGDAAPDVPRWRVDLASAEKWLAGLPSRHLDLLVTDPAYESLEKHRATGTTTRLAHSKASSNDWFEVYRNDRFPELFRQSFRVLKDNSHLYVLCDEETLFVVKPMAEAAGFRFWKSLVWVKTGGRAAADLEPEDAADSDVRIGMGYHWRNSTERIAFFEKGKRRLNKLGWADVLFAPRVAGGYPTEKPVALLERLILNSSGPGEIVGDPFTGSGSTGHAALKHGRCFRGCDLSQTAVDLASARLTALVDDGESCGGQ